MERGNGSMNPAIVGRDALSIAHVAGIDVPAGTRLLISDEKGVGPKYPFSKEKLTALLGFYVVEDWHEACELCTALLHNGGVGHSLAIHSRNEEVIREFGLKKPFRACWSTRPPRRVLWAYPPGFSRPLRWAAAQWVAAPPLTTLRPSIL